METTTANGINAGDSSAFLESVRQSGLVTLDRLDEWIASSPASVGVVDTVAQIVAAGLLTGYQARQVLNGKGHSLLLKGKYRVLDEIGTGGNGTVLLAEHVKMRKRVAVKVLPARKAADPLTLARFRREAAAVAALDHPNIVHAFDCDEEDGLHFLAMEYVEGTDLQKLVRTQGPLSVAQAVDLIAQAASGLHHAHAAGWVHRDVKPANLLLETSGRVKVLDLGLARLFAGDDDELTAKHDAGAVMGTIDFMAPEQTIDSSGVDHRADVYSLGATFYFLLVGRPPFPDGNVAQKLLARQVRDPAPIPGFRSDVPDHVVAIIARMMACDPGLRYSSLAEVIHDLRAGATTLPTDPPPTWVNTNDPAEADTVEADTVESPTNTTRKWVWRGASATVAILAVVVGLTASRGRKEAALTLPDQTHPVAEPGVQSATGNVAFVREQDRIEIRVAGKPFARYLTDKKLAQPYLANIQTLGGRLISESPVGEVQFNRYPGAWFSLIEQSANVERPSKVRLTRTGEIREPANETIHDTLTFVQGQRTGTTHIEETRKLRVSRVPAGVLLAWESEVATGASSVVRRGGTPNGFGLRLAKLSKPRVWDLQTPSGKSGTLSSLAVPWMEAATEADGRRWGAVLMPHPRNPIPSEITGRLESGVIDLRAVIGEAGTHVDTGLFTITPTRPVRMRYGLLVFETAATEPINPATVFRDYSASD